MSIKVGDLVTCDCNAMCEIKTKAPGGVTVTEIDDTFVFFKYPDGKEDCMSITVTKRITKLDKALE